MLNVFLFLCQLLSYVYLGWERHITHRYECDVMLGTRSTTKDENPFITKPNLSGWVWCCALVSVQRVVPVILRWRLRCLLCQLFPSTIWLPLFDCVPEQLFKRVLLDDDNQQLLIHKRNCINTFWHSDFNISASFPVLMCIKCCLWISFRQQQAKLSKLIIFSS